MKKVINLQERGITLTALVITIIIILILAGVTLGTLTGENGLISKAQTTTEKYQEESLKESQDIEELTSKLADIEKNTGTNGNNTLSNDNVYYKTIGNDKIPIPKDFYYVGGTKESGVVISDNPSDENVYADVENGDVPSGAKYNEDGTVDETNSTLKGNQFVFIPCEAENYKKITSISTSNSNYAFDTRTNKAELAQIAKYGGFYIGRYEAGTSNIVLKNTLKFGTPAGVTGSLRLG